MSLRRSHMISNGWF